MNTAHAVVSSSGIRTRLQRVHGAFGKHGSRVVASGQARAGDRKIGTLPPSWDTFPPHFAEWSSTWTVDRHSGLVRALHMVRALAIGVVLAGWVKRAGAMIEEVIMNGEMRSLSGGRSAYWRDGTIVIRNPRVGGGGVAFGPDFAVYAHQEGLVFNLRVRRATTLSGPLQRAVDAGQINLIRSLP